MNGLVLEGGAMRGMFTCGVIDVFMENGIAFDGAAGISAGAVFGCNLKSGQAGRPIRYNKRFCRDKRYCSFRSLLKTGDLYGADFCYRELPDVLDPFDREAFSSSPMAFYVGATDVDTGSIAYHLCTDGGSRDLLWMRASASMPVVSRSVEIDGRRYLDGGIADPVPYGVMEQNGYDRDVYVLTQPKGYRKRKPALLPLVRFALRNMPEVADCMDVRHEVYNRQMEEIDEKEHRGEILVIRPAGKLDAGYTEHDPDRLEKIYQTGSREAERMLPEVRAFQE